MFVYFTPYLFTTMPHLLLAYSEADAPLVTDLTTRSGGSASLHPLRVGRQNEGPVLADLTTAPHPSLVLLISPDFLTNPNCLLRLNELIARAETVVPLLVSEAARLGDRAQQTSFINHWQDRYLELRRDQDQYAGESRQAFDRYLDKVRSVSVGMEALLQSIVQHQPVLLSDTASLAARLPGDSAPASPPDSSDDESSPVLTAAQAIEQALTRSDTGDITGAIDLLRRAKTTHPSDPNIRCQLALHLALKPDGTNRAREELTQLLEDFPQHHDALLLSGELHLANGEYAATRSDWEQLYDLVPDYPGLARRLGILLVDHFTEATYEATEYLRKAAKREGADSELLYRYAALLAGTQVKSKRVIKWLRRCLRLDPDHAAARYLLAVTQYRRGKYKSATKQFRVAIALEPAYDTPANRRAFATSERQKRERKQRATLDALKQNVTELEAMLRARTTTKAEGPKRPRAGTGKTVLISGATSGIGLATARRLARDGFSLLLLGRRSERLVEVKKELSEAHRVKVHCLTLDVRDRKAVRAAVDGLPEELQHIDILINNAGKAKGFDPIYAGDLDHWDEMIDVNLRGLLYLTRAVTPGMVARGSGMVVNVCSTAGKEVYPNGNVYCATKHAVDALTYAMRLDLVRHGVRVGQICPAHVEQTEFAVVRFDGDRERAKIYEDFQPLRSPDVAEAIHFMVTQPAHVNVMDLVLQGTQQASSTVVDRSGRKKYAPEEE